MPGYELLTKSLEDLRTNKIRLLNVKKEMNDKGEETISALVYATSDKVDKLFDKIRDYANDKKITSKGKRANQDLVNSIEDFRIALFEDFWQGQMELMPNNSDKKWVEIWIRTDDNSDDRIAIFNAEIEKLHIRSNSYQLNFPERIVKVIFANKDQLLKLIRIYPYVAEIREAAIPNDFFLGQSLKDQIDWVSDLKRRIFFDSDKADKFATCILDTGVNNKHPLLEKIIKDKDLYVFNNAWNLMDNDGHGTMMSGIVLYNDLKEKLVSNYKYNIHQSVESMKILPDNNKNDPDLYGAIMEQAINMVELSSPHRRRNYCMAITSKESDGIPTSWSAAIDQLAFGDELEDFSNKRLIIVSVGNINYLTKDYVYFETNLLSKIEDPAQSWNCLSIGAYTDLVKHDFKVVAPVGGLTPSSRTSSIWTKDKPIKPDIVFEGGNYVDDMGIFEHHELQYLSLSNRINRELFRTIGDTSLATALASNFASELVNEYPEAWPETIRALMVHSAEWNNTMYDQLNIDKNNAKKKDLGKLLRVFGYGSPIKEKALYSQENYVNMIIEDYIQPFIKEKNGVKTNCMKYYRLPWPKNILEELSGLEVSIKITLSYFIQPAPGNVGWKDKYRYASNLLMFDIKNELETEQQFYARINSAIENDDGKIGHTSERWKLGANNRNKGSIHSDVWEGTAAELAQADIIAVYPGIGWWKERTNLKKYNSITRYSLIISIDVKQNINIYKEVLNIIKTGEITSSSPIEIELK